MRRVGSIRALAVASAITTAVLVHCATPTAILVDVYSELDCTNGAQVVLVGAQSLDALSTSAPTSYATRCEPQSDGSFYRGRVVLVPSTSDETVAFALATRTGGADPASCLASGADCIVSKRSIGFIQRTELTSEIHLRASCLGVVCAPSDTCEQGQCIHASVSCSGGSCGFPTAVAPELSAGAAHTCALRIDGTVVCWGDNSRGQLGDGTTTSHPTPTPVITVERASHLSGGGSGNHSCARVYDEDVVCWGANDHGQIGDGTTTDRPSPVNLGLCSCDDPVLLVAAGAAHTCIVRDNGGAVQCWGDNTFNQLGVGTQAAAIDAGSTLMNATSVSAGDRSTCALKQDNTVVCWGDNADGELGQGDTNPNPGIANAQVPAATSVSVAALGACVTTQAGDPFCWGSNATGLLLTPSPTPGVPVDMTALAGAKSISSAGGHACAIMSDGTVACWGLNDHGQCGDGTTTNRTTPGTVAGVQGVTAIASGLSHTCAWAKDGIYCWGDDTLGQLGDGKVGAISTTPVKVSVL